MLKPYDPAVRKLAAGLRAIVRSEVAPCHETIFDASYTIALLYGANARISENFCYISVHRKHVNLGFQRGSLLEDRNGVLKGDGPWMRHIQVKSPADLDRPGIAGISAGGLRGGRPHTVPGPKRHSFVDCEESQAKTKKPSAGRALKCLDSVGNFLSEDP